MDKGIDMSYEGPSDEERERIREAMRLAAEGLKSDDPDKLIEAFVKDPKEAAYHVLAQMKASDAKLADYSRTKKRLAEALDMAHIDGKTGLFRPERYSADIINMMAEMERDRKSTDSRDWSSLLLLDIDHFKVFNSEGGYNAGDRALAAVSHEIKAASSGLGDSYRYGGEEFVVLLSKTEPEEAKELGEDIRKRVERRDMPFPKSRDRQLTVSGGVGYLGGGKYPEANNMIYLDGTVVDEFHDDAEEMDPEGAGRSWNLEDFRDTMESMRKKWGSAGSDDERTEVLRKYTRKLRNMKGFREYHFNLLGKTIFYRANQALDSSKSNGRNQVSTYGGNQSNI